MDLKGHGVCLVLATPTRRRLRQEDLEFKYDNVVKDGRDGGSVGEGSVGEGLLHRLEDLSREAST